MRVRFLHDDLLLQIGSNQFTITFKNQHLTASNLHYSYSKQVGSLPTDNNNNNNDGSGTSTALIVGVSVAGAVAVVLLIVIVVLVSSLNY